MLKAEQLSFSIHAEKKIRRAQVSIVLGLGLTFYASVLLAEGYCYFVCVGKRFHVCTCESDVWCRMLYIPYTDTKYILTVVDFIQVQGHPTTAVWTAVSTSNSFVCMRDCMPGTYLRRG